MRVTRVVTAAAVAATCALSAPASAAPPELAGVNVIHGAKAAYLDVRLPRAVTLPTRLGGGPAIDVAGASKLAAFVLAGTDSRTRSVTVAGGQTAAGKDKQKFLMPLAPDGSGAYERTKTFGDSVRLPAGSYRLYVLSSGPATIFLRLPGLGGSRTMRPAKAARGAVLQSAHPLSSTPASTTTFAAADVVKLKRPGVALHALHAAVTTEAAWQIVMCHYDAKSAPVAETPACPTGRNHTVVTQRTPSIVPDGKLFVKGYGRLPAGDHGLSTIFTSQSATDAVGYSLLWLEL